MPAVQLYKCREFSVVLVHGSSILLTVELGDMTKIDRASSMDLAKAIPQ